MSRRRLLMCAYACAPPGTPTFYGGEELLGWSLAKQAARFHDVTVLASAEHRADIERTLAREPLPGVTFEFVDLPRSLGKLRERQGGIQLYAYLWQVKAYRVARRLHRARPFDLFHHVTYANDWMASHIGALLKIPFVRGPGGGAHRIPRPFLARYGGKFRIGNELRTLLQHALRADPFFRIGRRRAHRILVCNHEAMDALPASARGKAEYFSVNGVERADLAIVPAPRDPARFTVVYAGKLIGLKGVDLGLEAFARFAARHPDARLVVIGDGPLRARLEATARDLGVGHQVDFVGWRPRAEVLATIAGSDAFLFPSLRDGGGAVVIEAMAMGAPVVCFDMAGPALHVTAETGVKVPARDPARAVDALADALERLYADPSLRARLGKTAQDRVLHEYLWDVLGDRLAAIYAQALQES